MAVLDDKAVSVGEMSDLSGEPIAFPWVNGKVRPQISRESRARDRRIPLPMPTCRRFSPLYPSTAS